jgi:flagellin-like protein
MKNHLLKKIKKDEKAISPVVATVIIVAVAIAVAIAVAYWVTGLVPAFTRYEELKIVSTYVVDNETCKIEVKNTGSSDITISDVLVNARLPGDSGTDWTLDPDQALVPGDEATLTVYSDDFPIEEFISGVIYDFQVHTSGGGSYPSSARAP